ncbi:MAG: hypothetical protein LBI59_06180 [Candidatus Accumulibacter sp.]|jgi:predicted transposase YbfD/YdcC|nr:hypothetical protein [Accumulibacter sp.]
MSGRYDLALFGVVVSERAIHRKPHANSAFTSAAFLPTQKSWRMLAHSHWEIKNRLHWCLDICLNDDQACACAENAVRNLATMRRIVLNLFRLVSSGSFPQGRHQGPTYAHFYLQ